MIFPYKRTIIPSGEGINITATIAPIAQVEPLSKVVRQSFTTREIGNNLHNECGSSNTRGSHCIRGGSPMQRLG